MAEGVKVEGVDKVKEALDNIIKTVVTSVYDATVSMMDEVEMESQAQVPHDTGTLQNSARREEKLNTFTVKQILSYNTPYAKKWEYKSANFQKGRKSRYLRDPLEVAHGKLPVKVANALNKKLI